MYKCVCPWSKASGGWWVKLKRWSWNVFFLFFSSFLRSMNRCCRHWAPRCKKTKKPKTKNHHTDAPSSSSSDDFSFLTSEEESGLFGGGCESPLVLRASVLHRGLCRSCSEFSASGPPRLPQWHWSDGSSGTRGATHSAYEKYPPPEEVFVSCCFTALNQSRFKVLDWSTEKDSLISKWKRISGWSEFIINIKYLIVSVFTPPPASSLCGEVSFEHLDAAFPPIFLC